MLKLKDILIKTMLVTIVLEASIGVTFAQRLDKDVVEKAIASKSFVFKAQTMMPMTGMSRQLTTDYDVRLLGDSVVSYLPYFGRAYSVAYGESGGIDFTSTKFDYRVKERKKGGWDVTIKPKDTKKASSLNFTVSENGYATLQVMSNDRQPISYNGYIVTKK